MIVRRWFIENKDGDMVDGPFGKLEDARPEPDDWAFKHMSDLLVVEREVDIIDPAFFAEGKYA